MELPMDEIHENFCLYCYWRICVFIIIMNLNSHRRFSKNENYVMNVWLDYQLRVERETKEEKTKPKWPTNLRHKNFHSQTQRE